MIRDSCKDEVFLAQKAEPATPDLSLIHISCIGWGPDVKRPSFLRSNSCLAIHILQNPSQPGFGFTNEMNGLAPLLPSAPRTGRARQRYTPGRQQCGPEPRSAR